MGKGSSFSMLGEVSRLICGKNTSRRKSVASLSTRPSTMSLNLRLAMVGTWSRMVLRNQDTVTSRFTFSVSGLIRRAPQDLESGPGGCQVAETHHILNFADEEAPRSFFSIWCAMYYHTHYCIFYLTVLYCMYYLSVILLLFNHLPSSCPTSPSK